MTARLLGFLLMCALIGTIGVALGVQLVDAANRPRLAHSAVFYRQAWRGERALRKDREHTMHALRRLRQRDMRRFRRRVARSHMYGIARDSQYAIRLAAITWRLPEGDLLRVAECESPGLDATLVNAEPIYNGERAAGLFQFIPSTWNSTPYSGLSVFDPIANALAAGWLVTHDGGWRQWACKP